MYRCFFTILTLLVFCSPLYAQPAMRTLSGTVSYKGDRKERIYITARTNPYNSFESRSFSTSIAEPGPFEIGGVPVDGEYMMSAVMESGLYERLVSAPASPTAMVYPGEVGTGLILELQDRQGAFCAPPDVDVFPQEGGLLVRFTSTSVCNNATVPERLIINWSTDESFRSGYGIADGVTVVPFDGSLDAFVALKKGKRIFVRVASQTGGGDGPFSIPVGPFVTGDVPDGQTVEGTVTIPRKYVGKKAVLIGRSSTETRAILVSATSTRFNYRIGGFIADPQVIYGFIDLDGNGIRNGSDPYIGNPHSELDTDLVLVEPSGAEALSASVVVTAYGTRYVGFSETYELCFVIRPLMSLTGATVLSGPEIKGPVDMSFFSEPWMTACNAKLIVPKASAGDEYVVRFAYPDGRVETQTAVVTGVAPFLIPIKPIGLLSAPQGQIFSWNRGDSVLTASPRFYGGSTTYNPAWSSTLLYPLGDDNYLLPEPFSQSQTSRNSWTIENHDTHGNVSRVTAPYYYGRGSVAVLVTDRSGESVAGVTARLEDQESGAVIAENTVGENGETSFEDVIPGRYRCCFEGKGFPLQCLGSRSEPYGRGWFDVYADQTSYRDFTLYRKGDAPVMPEGSLVLNDGRELTTTPVVPVVIPDFDSYGDSLMVRTWWDDEYWRDWWMYEPYLSIGIPGSGRHTLYVEFQDKTGRKALTSASIILDDVPPVALLDKKPDPSSTTSSCLFTLRQGDVVAYRASLDGGELSDEIPVDQPFERSGLAYGMHSFSVFGRDAAGNWQKLPSEYIWLVDVPTAAIALQEAKKSWVVTVQGEGLKMYRYRLGNGKYSSPRSASKPISIRKNFTGTVSVLGRSANGTWQKIPSLLQIPPATL